MDMLIFQNVIIAMVLGFAIGLQREMNILYFNRKEDFGGARTFSIIGLMGYLSAWLSTYVPHYFIVATLVLGALLIGAYIVNSDPKEKGVTTEFSAVLTFMIGGILVFYPPMFPVFVGIVILFVLNIKDKIKQYEKAIEKKDLSAAIIFLMMTFVVLPILPDRAIDIWGYLNLYKIWLMVVLVAGISFFGYIAVRFIGPTHGIRLAGFFGGLVSSTAVALSMGRRGKENPSLSKDLALGVILACSIMLIRALIEIYVINTALAMKLLIPVIVATIFGYAYILYLFFTVKTETIIQEITFKNPFELNEALILGLIFGVVLALVKFSDHLFGDLGVYFVSFVAGIADIDAVVLSLASFVKTDLSSTTALNAIITAIVANSITKLALVAFLGNRVMAYYVGIYFVIMLTTFIGTYIMIGV